MSGDGVTPAVVGILVLVGGAMIYRERERARELGQARPAIGLPQQQQPVNPVQQFMPPGSTAAPLGSPAATQADIQRSIQFQQIEEARRDLARVTNDMKVLIAQADAIKANRPDQTYKQGIENQVYAECRAGTNFLTSHIQCNWNTLGSKVNARIESEWAAKIANDLRPIQAQLSRLYSDQIAYIDALKRLGVEIPVSSIQKGTV